MSDAPELKPCPFCGGNAERIEIEDDEPTNSGGSVICCSVCQASSHVEFGRKENLVSLWNRRADLAHTDAQVMALVDALDAMIGAVCGDTGFAACVRADTGRAYPWPSLDAAEERARAALRDLDGGNG